MKTWFEFKAKADNTAEVSIFDEIGMWGVTAANFIAELKQHKGKKITMSINSPGGSVFDALAIYNALRGHGSEITAKVMGIAASAASLIAMAGDKIVMPANSFMMIHNPIGGVYGNAEDMREIADVLDKIGASLVSTYVARTGLPEEEVRALLAAETWLTADEALAKGFADEVEASLAIAAVFNTERLPENIKAVFKAQDGAIDGQENTPTEDAETNNPSAGSETTETGAGQQGAQHEPDAALADQISAMAVSFGMQDHLGVWLLDTEIKTAEQAKPLIAEAREVRALCVVAKRPDMAAKLIRQKTDIAGARAALTDALALQDEQTNTDGKLSRTPIHAASGSAVWAKIFPPAAQH